MNPIRSAVVVTLAAVSWAALAQTAPQTPRVDAREAAQDQRIDQGAASGQLTARETQRLEREQTAIANSEAKAKADGTVTAKERARLSRMQNAAGRDIRHQKHDRQVAPAK